MKSLARKSSRRDRRFVAVHRGGPLDLESHRLLATWAADCAEHVLSLFDLIDDDHPQLAIEVARAWARGELTVGGAQKAAIAAHAAARAATTPAAIAVARAAGHAAATAHAADHCLGAALYACKAAKANDAVDDEERAWQISRLPVAVRELVISGLARRGI